MADQVEVTGSYTDDVRVSSEADERRHVFHFCPSVDRPCRNTEHDASEFVTVMVGAFADRAFPPPERSGYGVRRHPWVVLPDGIRHDEVWAPFNDSTTRVSSPRWLTGRGTMLADQSAKHPAALQPRLL